MVLHYEMMICGGKSMTDRQFQSGRIGSYFRAEWKVLLLVTGSGLVYNFGLLATPWFEGKLAGRLMDVLTGKSGFASMLTLVFWYVAVIAAVQGFRCVKRFYVRRFANHVNRRMKKILYHSLLHKSKAELEQEGVGSVMTKAISDVDDCAEGMRKFTTELFDTGVALVCYCGMLLYYDWRLALTCMLFPPVSCFLAEKMKSSVQKAGADYKNQAASLSSATMDRAQNALTYRVFGCENLRQEQYEQDLSSYEVSAVKANIRISALPPLYRIISMAGVLPILYFGSRNVLSHGWNCWDIAVFTTFLSCYTKLAVKSSKTAKLFNAVHKAQVSWKRIQPFLTDSADSESVSPAAPEKLTVSNLSFAYPSSEPIFRNISFEAEPGQIIGITGPVACGKSTLGKTFLCEYPYSGSIRYGNRELSGLPDSVRCSIVGYLGHDPELLNDNVRNNILLGDSADADAFLRAVCLDQEVRQMEEGLNTVIGSSGAKLSGGQAQRLALARTLCHRKPILILDDPFSALDRKTEAAVFANLKKLAEDNIVLLISHRFYLFPQMDQVLWMNHGTATAGTHEELLRTIPEYAALYAAQEGGGQNEA